MFVQIFLRAAYDTWIIGFFKDFYFRFCNVFCSCHTVLCWVHVCCIFIKPFLISDMPDETKWRHDSAGRWRTGWHAADRGANWRHDVQSNQPNVRLRCQQWADANAGELHGVSLLQVVVADFVQVRRFTLWVMHWITSLSFTFLASSWKFPSSSFSCCFHFWIIIDSDRRPETKQGIEGKIDRFRSGRVRVRIIKIYFCSLPVPSGPALAHWRPCSQWWIATNTLETSRRSAEQRVPKARGSRHRRRRGGGVLMEGVSPSPADYGVYGSVVSSPSGVRGSANAWF